MSFVLFCLGLSATFLTFYLYFFDDTGAKLLAGQVRNEQGQKDSAESSARVEEKLDSILKDQVFLKKYPLGYCVFYADNSSDIKRVGTADVRVHWEEIVVSSDRIRLSFVLSGHRGQAGMAGAMSRSFERKSDTHPIATILNETQLVFEIVENRDDGVVGILGLRPTTTHLGSGTVGITIE